jgi:hypothetical protein
MRVRLVILILTLMITCEPMALAYTDPGSGLFVWQFLFSGWVGAMFFLRKQIARLFSKKQKKTDKASDDQ